MRLGTRGSALAMVQTRGVAERLQASGLAAPEIVVLKTQGDQNQEQALRDADGTGLFTKELEDALLQGRIDAAVHSLKDLPTRLAAGLELGAISTREDWRDAWLSAQAFGELPAGSRVGTGSPRRRAQLALLRPDLQFVEFRGNVDTRLRKLAEGQAEGAVLAAAGLKRLGRLGEAKSIFGVEEMLPAPGQGFLGIECRQGDSKSLEALAVLNDRSARACAEAERNFLDRLGAGCHAPLAALALLEGGRLRLQGFTQNADSTNFRGSMEGDATEASALGIRLAETLMGQGAEMTR